MKKNEKRGFWEKMGFSGRSFLRVLKGVVVVSLLAYLLSQFVLSPRFVLKRETVVGAPPAAIMPLVSNFRERERWSDWKKRDPSVRFHYGDVPEGVGASRQWITETGVGGIQRIVQVDGVLLLRTEMDFGSRGWASTTWKLEPSPSGRGTRVTWFISANLSRSPIGAILAPGLKRALERSFDGDINSLKQLAEVQAGGT